MCKNGLIFCVWHCARVSYGAVCESLLLSSVQESATMYYALCSVQGSCPGSLPSQPRSPFALHSFYWAVTPFVGIIIIIIIIIINASLTSSSHWWNIMSQLVSADCFPYRHLRAWNPLPAFFMSSSFRRHHYHHHHNFAVIFVIMIIRWHLRASNP